MITLKNINLQYETRKIFENCSVRIERHQRVVILGPSGHGKSSLIKIMAGLKAPTSGEVLMNEPGTRKAMLFQKNALFDSMSVQENVAFVLREQGNLSEDEIQQKVAKALTDVGLQGFANSYPAFLSGGMQKRLGLARVLVLNADLIFYDDPTAGLDPITGRNMIDLILHFQKQMSSTLVVVTNEFKRAAQVATRYLFLADGRLLSFANQDEFLKSRDPKVQRFIESTHVHRLNQSGRSRV